MKDSPRNRFKRKLRSIPFIKQIHVYTEGEITEKEYLEKVYGILDSEFDCRQKFHLRIKTSKGQSSPKNLKKTIRRDVLDLTEKEYHEIWVLIDQDSWPIDDIEALNNDPQISRSASKFRVLISIPKFEIWLILHFDKGGGIVTSVDVDKKMKRIFPQYNKHCENLVLSLEQIKEAISNARQKIKQETGARTYVYELIEHLIELAK